MFASYSSHYYWQRPQLGRHLFQSCWHNLRSQSHPRSTRSVVCFHLLDFYHFLGCQLRSIGRPPYSSRQHQVPTCSLFVSLGIRQGLPALLLPRNSMFASYSSHYYWQHLQLWRRLFQPCWHNLRSRSHLGSIRVVFCYRPLYLSSNELTDFFYKLNNV